MFRIPFSNRSGRRKPNRRGATAVEFAFVAPVLFAVIFTSLEFSRIAMMRSLAQSAAYEACRYVIVEGSNRQEALDEANRVLARLGTQNATIEINDGAEITATTSEVTVEVRIPMEDNSFLIAPLLANRFVTSEITLRTERYTGFYDGGADEE